MSSSRAFAMVVLALLAVLSLLLAPVQAQNCTGAAIVNGPASESYQYFWPADQLLGSVRTLTVTQQVTQLAMSFYWSSANANAAPVHVSLALYGPPNCGPQGESQLLGVTSVYTFAAGNLSSSNNLQVVTLSLTSPIIVVAGQYVVLAESDNVNMTIITGATAAGYQPMVAESYTRNTYTYSSANFPSVAYFVTYYLGQDALGQILGTTCTGTVTPTPLPTCVPKPFIVSPASAVAALPCTTASALYTNTYTNSLYNYQSNAATDTVRLIPLLINATQTIYSVSFLFHPETSATTTFTMRPAVYQQTATTTFTLLAQANQTVIPGSSLAGQFTEYYFPIYPPILVSAGSTIYINRLVDQAGLVLVFDQSGGTFTGTTVITSNQSAPTTITTTGTGGIDASRGVLGCPAAQPVTSSTGGGGSSGGGTTCTGAAIVNGPASESYQYFWPADQLLGSVRTLTVTQQVTQLAMSFYWSSANANAAPVHVSLALYGPPNCGPQGESQLLGVTSVYTFAAGNLSSSNNLQVVTLSLTSPIIVVAGQYVVLAESDNVNMTIITGATAAGYQPMVAESYTRNTYTYSSANFPSVAYFVTYYLGQDALGQILGTTCTGTVTPTPLPTCTPIPFIVAPASAVAAAPCTGASQIYTNTYNNSLYNYQSNAATDTVRLIPTTITASQIIYAVSFLFHPETSATTVFTMRPAVYSMTGATTFSLLAQANQTVIQGSTLAGQFTEYYFPIYPPITVAAGTTIYINRLVDQAGVVFVFDQTGGTYTGTTVITSNQTAPTTITTTGTGGVDASRGVLGCATTIQPTTSSTAVAPVASTARAAVSSSAATAAPTAAAATSTPAVTPSTAAPLATSTPASPTSEPVVPPTNPGNGAAEGRSSSLASVTMAAAAALALLCL